MTRREEIEIKALSEYRIKEKENKKATGTYDANLPRRKAFIEGAKWADKTMIEKACEWMKQQVYQEYGGGPLERLVPDERIADFRKTMEE